MQAYSLGIAVVHRLPIVNVIQPGGDFRFRDSFLAVCVSDAPAPPELRAGRQRSALAHFPCPFRVDRFARYELWKSFCDHLATGLLLISIFQYYGCDIHIASYRSVEGG